VSDVVAELLRALLRFDTTNRPGNEGSLSMVHSADERVPVEALRFGAEAVGRAVASYER
jgi:hypothetical protein